MDNWMLYGCTGFSGKLIIEEALKRGHKPLLAGRSEGKTAQLAEKYDLSYTFFLLRIILKLLVN